MHIFDIRLTTIEELPPSPSGHKTLPLNSPDRPNNLLNSSQTFHSNSIRLFHHPNPVTTRPRLTTHSETDPLPNPAMTHHTQTADDLDAKPCQLKESVRGTCFPSPIANGKEPVGLMSKRSPVRRVSGLRRSLSSKSAGDEGIRDVPIAGYVDQGRGSGDGLGLPRAELLSWVIRAVWFLFCSWDCVLRRARSGYSFCEGVLWVKCGLFFVEAEF